MAEFGARSGPIHVLEYATQVLQNLADVSGLMDAATGLFTRDLFAAHLMRLAAAARARNRPLAVCVLKVAERPEVTVARAGGWLDRAIPQIGSMIGRLVRAEDTAARLGPNDPSPARFDKLRRSAKGS